MKKRTPGRQLVLRTLSRSATKGILEFGPLRLACAIGRSGIRAQKREGDGATPRGAFSLVEAYYRSDRMMRPRTGLPLRALRPQDGWCDAADDRNYNRHVRHPYPASAEHMWRQDPLYDALIVVDHNRRPRVRGVGSAIFIHVALESYSPTAGCVALRRAGLIRLLPRLTRQTVLRTAI
jgi:L,D-peptidoglycan transpeptidase YkuD (ErfK/YbiS/YcfS/YnhG family)